MELQLVSRKRSHETKVEWSTAAWKRKYRTQNDFHPEGNSRLFPVWLIDNGEKLMKERERLFVFSNSINNTH